MEKYLKAILGSISSSQKTEVLVKVILKGLSDLVWIRHVGVP